jgi:hypothetical protein
MQEIAWLIRNRVDLDAAQLNQFYRVPFLEIESMISFEEKAVGATAKVVFTLAKFCNWLYTRSFTET